jgi:outer membrane protein assembly factor BamB
MGLLILVLMQVADAGDWSMFMHDASHTGVAEETVEPPLNLLWKYKTGGSIYSSPVVSDGVVYIASDDSFVYALDAVSGSLNWKFETDGSIYSSPAVTGGLVFISSADTYLYALNASTGSLKWKYKLYTGQSVYFKRTLPNMKWKSRGDSKFGSLAVSDGILYIAGDEYIYALDADTGSLKWRYNSVYLARSSPAVSGEMVFIGGNWGIPVEALDASTGILKWQSDIDEVDSSPVVSGRVVYICSWDTYLYALNANTGNVIWKFKTNNSLPYSSPAVSGEVVYLNALDGYVYALDANTGSLKWKFKTGGFDSISSPAVSGNAVFTVVDKYLYAIDARTGNLKWKYETGNTVGPAISEGMVYVGSNDGNLYAFAPQNGSITSSKPSKPIETSTTPWNVILPSAFIIVIAVFFLLIQTKRKSKKEEIMAKQEMINKKNENIKFWVYLLFFLAGTLSFPLKLMFTGIFSGTLTSIENYLVGSGLNKYFLFFMVFLLPLFICSIFFAMGMYVFKNMSYFFALKAFVSSFIASSIILIMFFFVPFSFFILPLAAYWFISVKYPSMMFPLKAFISSFYILFLIMFGYMVLSAIGV